MARTLPDALNTYRPGEPPSCIESTANVAAVVAADITVTRRLKFHEVSWVVDRFLGEQRELGMMVQSHRCLDVSSCRGAYGSDRGQRES